MVDLRVLEFVCVVNGKYLRYDISNIGVKVKIM